MRLAAGANRRFWWLRGKTLGVRAVVHDQRNVFLVRHTYVPGWYLPGGGVDGRETAEEAVRRELREEAGIEVLDRPRLHGVFRNHGYSVRDHVVCFVVTAFEARQRTADWEIAEAGFFPIDALPDGTTAATRARLAEIFQGAEIAPDW